MITENRQSQADAHKADLEPGRSDEDRTIEPNDARGGGHSVSPSKLSTEKQLDHGLKETFPASDPVSINPGAD